jgi:dihydrofolate reductase
MSKIVVSEFLSADGVMEAPDTWQFPFQTEEMGAITERQTRDTDAYLLGRVTYEVFAGFWPTQTHNEFGVADKLNSAPKYVVSTTLQKADWNNSTQIKSNVIEEIRKLKQQPGKNMGVAGSPTLVQSLLQSNLLDELTLMVHPVVVGSGKRLFKDGSDLKRLKLVDTETTSTGVAILTYQPRRNSNDGA